MIIDRNTLQSRTRKQVETYEKKCSLVGINIKNIVFIIAIISFITGLADLKEIINKFLNWQGVFSLISIIMIYIVLKTFKNNVGEFYYAIKDRFFSGKYELLFGEITEIKVMHNKKTNRYKYMVIIDNIKLTVKPSRFVTHDFKHIYNEQKLFNYLKQAIPLHTTRLCFINLQKRELIFDLTNFIRL